MSGLSIYTNPWSGIFTFILYDYKSARKWTRLRPRTNMQWITFLRGLTYQFFNCRSQTNRFREWGKSKIFMYWKQTVFCGLFLQFLHKVIGNWIRKIMKGNNYLAIFFFIKRRGGIHIKKYKFPSCIFYLVLSSWECKISQNIHNLASHFILYLTRRRENLALLNIQ